jgi:hypothetical protein
MEYISVELSSLEGTHHAFIGVVYEFENTEKINFTSFETHSLGPILRE